MSKEKLKGLFPSNSPNNLTQEFSDYACVAAVLSLSNSGCSEKKLRIAFIRRAENPADPWSGHIAFPGGRREAEDPDDLSTAVRETNEEVGWTMTQPEFMGFLPDVKARNKSGLLPFFLRPLVFFSEQELPLDKFSSDEVAEVFWIPVEHLLDNKNYTMYAYQERINVPGIKFPDGNVLWGLTYVITQNLLASLKTLKKLEN